MFICRKAFGKAREYNRIRLEEEIQEKTKRIENILSDIKKQAVAKEKKQQKTKR